MKATQDYYTILGVAPDSPIEDIKAAYRQAVRRLHPDTNTNPAAALQFRDIAEAYEVLGDEHSRAEYDHLLKQQGPFPTYFSTHITPSKRILRLLDEPQVLYVLVEITPDPRYAAQTNKETMLNLALVIDRSTSMKGARLDRVKQAVHRIIDTLRPDDILTLVSFSDRAEVVVEATPVQEKSALKAMVSVMQASGGTEIFQGMQEGIKQLRRTLDRRRVNHLILLTDGQTYGDEEQCLRLAHEVSAEGISISAIGIGEEWNDAFLDDLASRTGGTSTYINSPAAVEQFLNTRVRSLGGTFIERLHLSVAPDADITLEDAFKITPSAQPLPAYLPSIPLGGLESDQVIHVILQLQLPPLDTVGFRTVVRLDTTGDILSAEHSGYKVISDLSIEIAETIEQENPPLAILEALGKLTLYRMQAKAQEAILRGDIRQATRQLENLATRLFENGQEALAHAALAEARRVARTTMLSEEGQKKLKYGTRALLLPPSGNKHTADQLIETE